MILKKIVVDSFGKLKDFTLDFSNGINLIFGENEAGKSTLCAFLYAMFYGLPNESKKLGIREDFRRRYRPWDDSVMSGSVFFSDNGRNYILSRKFGKTSRSDKFSLKNEDNWEEITDVASGDIGSLFLGVGADAFLKTMLITQTSTVSSAAKEDEILRRLANLKQSGDEEISYQKVSDILEKAKLEMVSKSEKAGLLPKLQQKQEELQQELFAVNRLTKQFQKDILRQNTLQQEELILQKEATTLTAQKQLAKEHNAYLAFAEQQEKINLLLQRKENFVQKTETCQNQVANMTNTLESLNALQGISQEKLLEWAQTEKELDELKQKQAKLSDIKEELHVLEEKQQALQQEKRSGINLPMFVISVILAVLGIVCRYFLTSKFFVMLPIAIFLSVLACMGNKKCKEQKKLLEENEQEILRLQNEQNNFGEEALNKRVETLKEELESVYFATDTKTLSELSQKVTKRQQLLNEKELTEKEQKLLLENLQQIETELNASTAVSPEKEFSEQAKMYVGATEEKTDSLILENHQKQLENQRERDRIAHSLETAFSDTRSADVILSELESLKEKIAETEHFYNALCMAEQAMEDSYRQLKQDFAPLLNCCVGEILSELTKGKYDEIKLSDDYKIMLRDKEYGDIVSAEYLSAGTYDSLYLALRFGIVRTILSQKPLFLILDDAFLQLDDTRAKLAAEYLNRESAEGQVLYFTCHRSQQALFGADSNPIVLS